MEFRSLESGGFQVVAGIEGERVADLVEDPPELRRTTLIEKTHRVCVLPPPISPTSASAA
jgi:hypothetical protein